MNEFIIKNGLIVNGNTATTTFSASNYISASSLNVGAIEIASGNLLLSGGAINLVSGSITLTGGGTLVGTASYALAVVGTINSAATASYLLVPSASNNFVPKWSANTLTTASLIFDSGVGIGINKSSVTTGFILDVSGSVISSGAISATTLTSSVDMLINGTPFGKGSGSLSGNIAIGVGAAGNLVTASNSNNIAIGSNAMANVNATNASSVAIGANAMGSTSGAVQTSNCVAVGTNSLQIILTSGSTTNNLVAIGYGAMTNVSGSAPGSSVAVGFNALNLMVGNGNTAVGFSALASQKHPTGGNTAIGTNSQKNQYSGSSFNNTSVGTNALVGPTSAANVAIGGFAAQYLNSSSGNNTVVGTNALNGNATTSSAACAGNTVMGQQAGYNTINTPVSANDNIFIGNRAGYNSSGSYNIIFGATGSVGCDSVVLGGSNQLLIGNTIYGTGLYTNAAKIGINVQSPINTLDVLGNISASVVTASVVLGGHHVGNTATPSVVSGSASGATATVSVTGSDAGGILSVLTGTSTNTTGALCTVTYAFAYAKQPSVILMPYEINSATYGGGNLYATSSTTGFSVFPGTAAFAATTQYKWNYIVVG